MVLVVVVAACTPVEVAPEGWPAAGCEAATPGGAVSAGAGIVSEGWLQREDGVRLALATRFPEGVGCVGAVVYAPPGFDPGTGRVEEAQSVRLADAGAALITFDPRGRRNSEGEEDANGSLGQADFAAVMRWAANQPRVDPTQVVVYSRSFGGALASGALAHDGSLAPLAWVDFESPGWLRDDLDHAAEHTAERMRALAADSGDQDAWFDAREPAGFVGEVPVPYHRMQGNPDHALDTMAAAVAMVNGATASPEVTFNGVEVAAALSEESAAAAAIAGGLDPEGDTMTDAVLSAFGER